MCCWMFLGRPVRRCWKRYWRTSVGKIRRALPAGNVTYWVLCKLGRALGNVKAGCTDPTFRQATDELWLINHACMIEWLRQSGNITVTRKPRKNSRRWIKQYAPLTFPLLMIFCLALGIALGWLLFR